MGNNKICPTCTFPIPKKEVSEIPCSEYHVRCVRCGWPVAKNYIEDDEVCDLCKGKKK